MAVYLGNKRVKVLSGTGMNLIPPIPDRTYSGDSGEFESKDGVITFGGVMKFEGLGASFCLLNHIIIGANYPKFYVISNYDLDILPGTYTISMRVSSTELSSITLILGEVGTALYLEEKPPFFYENIKPFHTSKDGVITKTFTVDKPMKIALLGNTTARTVGEEIPLSTVSEIMLNEGDTALPYEPYIKRWKIMDDPFLHLYQPVEYIESTGTQYIDTNYHPNKTTNYEIDMQVSSILSAPQQYLAASQYSRFMPKLFGYLTVEMKSEAFYYNFEGRNTVKIFDKDIYINGIFKNKFSIERDIGSDPLPIWLFSSAGEPGLPSAMKLYSLKIWETNNLIRHFIPVYRRADKEIGLYDKVNNKFYTNNGTGLFLKGGDI